MDYNNIFILIIKYGIFLCFTTAIAQVNLTGTIKNKKGENMPDINILISNPIKRNISIAYAFTNDDGKYDIEVNSLLDSLFIQVTGFNIANKSKLIANKSGVYNFEVEESFIELKEVEVKATKIWNQGDTINFLVNAYTSNSDVTIGDVLKKMPGINVKPSGAIEYNGLPINKFYIEGLDLLKGRYGIATNNISPKDIATVQVLENHQPIKTLKNLRFSDQAAINLKLKESAKGILSLTAMLGIGADKKLLWENELTGMYFTRQRQHILTYKGNNSGTDLNRELQSFTPEDAGFSGQIMQMLMPNPPNINRSKYYFNNSNAITFNNIYKTKGNGDVNVNLIYWNDHEQRNSYAHSSYMLPDGTLNNIDEIMSSASNIDRLEGEASYKYNEDKNYLNNEVKFGGEWRHGSGSIQTEEKIKQSIEVRKFKASNRFFWITRGEDNKGYEINSFIDAELNPEDLYVQPCLYDSLFGEGDFRRMHQNLERRRFGTRNSLSRLSAFILEKVSITPSMFLNFEYDELYSALLPYPLSAQADGRFKNDIRYHKFDAGLDLAAHYEYNRFKLNFDIPIRYNYRSINQDTLPSRPSQQNLFPEPYLKFLYEFPFSLNISISGGLRYNVPELSTLYNGYILADYRNLSSYETNLSDNLSYIGNLKFDYKDILNIFFGGLTVSYRKYYPKVIYGRAFDGILSKTITRETDANGQSFSVNFRLSKGFDWKQSKIAFDMHYGKNRNPLLVQNEIVGSYNNAWIINGSLNIKPFSIFELVYSGTISQINSFLDKSNEFIPVKTAIHNLSFHINLPHNIIPNLTLYNYYNNRSAGSKSFTLADMNVSHIYKKIRLTLSWNNIFDVGKYNYSRSNNLSYYYSEYTIRPTSIMLKVRWNMN